MRALCNTALPASERRLRRTLRVRGAMRCTCREALLALLTLFPAFGSLAACPHACEFTYKEDDPSSGLTTLYFFVRNEDPTAGTCEVWLTYFWYSACAIAQPAEGCCARVQGPALLGRYVLDPHEVRGPYVAFHFPRASYNHGYWRIWHVSPDGESAIDGSDSL